mgnify:CR=1 FL=1
MVRSICFTGHRHIARAELPALLKELRRVLETAIPQGFVDFYAGGALGWDTYCAQTVLDLREEYPCIALHLVLPCSRGEQTARWTEAQKAAYDCIFREADSDSCRRHTRKAACGCGTSGWGNWRTAVSAIAVTPPAEAAQLRLCVWQNKKAYRSSIW